MFNSKEIAALQEALISMQADNTWLEKEVMRLKLDVKTLYTENEGLKGTLQNFIIETTERLIKLEPKRKTK